MIYTDNALQIDALREYALLDYIVFRSIAPNAEITNRQLIERDAILNGGTIDKASFYYGDKLRSNAMFTHMVNAGHIVPTNQKHDEYELTKIALEKYDDLVRIIKRNNEMLSENMQNNIYNICILISQYYVRMQNDNPPDIVDAIFFLKLSLNKLINRLDGNPIDFQRLVFLTRADLLAKKGYKASNENIRSLIPGKNTAAIRTMWNLSVNADGLMNKDGTISEAGEKFIKTRVSNINNKINEAVEDENKKGPIEYMLKGIMILEKIIPTLIRQDIAYNNFIDDEIPSHKWPVKRSLFEALE